jgi:hypothetical protein
MKRRVQDLSHASAPAEGEIPDGIFLVRVHCAKYCWDASKPYYLIRFSIQQPKRILFTVDHWPDLLHTQSPLETELVLADFGYDTELLSHDEIEDKRLIGRTGVVKISHVVRNGTSLLNLEAFAPAGQWNELSPASASEPHSPEVTP